MPMVPAVPVLPADMLRPIDIVNKFRPRSLAGLGQDEYLDTSGQTPADWGIYIDPETGQQYQYATAGSSEDYQVGGSYIPPSGANPTQVFFPGSSVTVPSNVASTSSGRVNTASSDAATQAFIAAMVKGGLSLAQIAALQPGTVVQTDARGNSTILRQSSPGQTPVPVTLFGGTVSGTAVANSGATIAIVAAVAVGAFLLFNRR